MILINTSDSGLSTCTPLVACYAVCRVGGWTGLCLRGSYMAPLMLNVERSSLVLLLCSS